MTSYNDVATNFDKWQEYVDPMGVMSQDEFDQMPIDEKMREMTDAFGVEKYCTDCNFSSESSYAMSEHLRETGHKDVDWF